ncbi:MAG TPA: beta-glycosidase, partial [Bacteroidales bacterium]|nr:beta-glycosidase [Bacteroidales bacterium]
SYHGGILNTQPPSTDVTFDRAVSHVNVPVVGHEIGQYQIYPDYGEIEKYTGVLRAHNLEVFRDRLNKAGMGDQDSIFQKASGAWSALCYKAEMEAALRTKGFAGFQLLDLQDFPGQGTALVGILNAFMEPKNVVTRQEWLHSCNDVVLLLEFTKYCRTTDEPFNAKLVVANYSNRSFTNDISWIIKDESDHVLAEGILNEKTIENGGLTTVGRIHFDPGSIKRAEKLTVSVSLEGTPYANSYPVWVYPSESTVPEATGILITQKLDDNAFDKLNRGGSVLLFPKAGDVRGKSVGGLFPPDFWNYGMFKSISEGAGKSVSPGTLGLLMDPNHPLFNDFPTDFHTNWQWFSIIKASNPFILDETPVPYRPIVQVIDNLERNHKLGLIFEFRVGKGKLLVCMSQLPGIVDKPEARQLFRSMVEYMKTAEFTPKFEISPANLKLFFRKGM